MKSLAKAKDVLCAVGGEGGATLSDLTRRIGMPKSTVYRLLRALESNGFVTRPKQEQARYELGPLIKSLANGSSNTDRLITIAHPFMVCLRDASNETVALHILEARRWIAIDQVESTEELRRTFTNLGEPMPLHAGAPGKVFLANMPEGERNTYLRENELRSFTPNTITNRRRLISELQKIAVDGYAISFQEVAVGVAGICMPIHSRDGMVRVAIGVSGPISRFTPKSVAVIRDLLKKWVPRLERELGTSINPSMHRGPLSDRPARHRAVV